jgi:hypothetical protein
MYLRDVYCCHDSIDTQEIKNDAPLTPNAEMRVY